MITVFYPEGQLEHARKVCERFALRDADFNGATFEFVSDTCWQVEPENYETMRLHSALNSNEDRNHE